MKSISTLILPIILNKLKKRLDIANRDLLKKYDLSKLHLLYLMVIFENEEGMTLKELSDYLDFDKANTSRAISQLISKEYVQKKAQGDLELKYKVELTAKGRNVATIIWEQNQKANTDFIQLFTPEELMSLAKIAGKLWNFLSRDETHIT